MKYRFTELTINYSCVTQNNRMTSGRYGQA